MLEVYRKKHAYQRMKDHHNHAFQNNSSNQIEHAGTSTFFILQAAHWSKNHQVYGFYCSHTHAKRLKTKFDNCTTF